MNFQEKAQYLEDIRDEFLNVLREYQLENGKENGLEIIHCWRLTGADNFDGQAKRFKKVMIEVGFGRIFGGLLKFHCQDGK